MNILERFYSFLFPIILKKQINIPPNIARSNLNFKSSIVAPSSVSWTATWNEIATKWMQEAFVQMYTGGEPERPLGRYFPRFAGDQELFIAVCVCVCVVRDHSESQSFLFSRNRRRPRWPHWLLEIHRKHEPAYAPTTSVLASRGRCFSCPRVARCTAKINSPCASELHLFVLLG